MATAEFSILLGPYRAVYIDIAKVASSSIKAALASLLHLDGGTDNPHDVAFPRPPAADHFGVRLYPDYFTFAFVRDPWDRLVSCYRDKILGEVADFTGFDESGVAHCLSRFGIFRADMTFAEFVRAVAEIDDADADEHFRSQADFVTNAAGAIAVDFVGRFETLDTDFPAVAERLGLPPGTQLLHLQAAPARDYRSFYDPETSALVARRYAADVELFGYRSPALPQ